MTNTLSKDKKACFLRGERFEHPLKREWFPHLDYSGEPMKEGEFRDPPELVNDPFDEGWNAALNFVRRRVGFYLSEEDADAIRFYICKSAERNGIRRSNVSNADR